ncbi:ribonuclease HII [soil metagenome]
MVQSNFTKLLAFDGRTLKRAKKSNTSLSGAGGGAAQRSSATTGEQLTLFKTSTSGIVGVDEVGRGCLSGPVVAAAVMFPSIVKKSFLAEELAELNDSKALSERQRERLSEILRNNCYFSVAEASPAEIDQINILQASLLAMRRAIDALLSQVAHSPEELLLLVDGNQKVKGLNLEQITVIQGDSHSAAIAAASIIAKVYRDRLMLELSKDHPAYSWHTNKGYGSKAHRAAIVEHGVTKWHRLSFRLFDAEDL